MQWLNTIVDELLRRHPDGEIVVSSGVSPSGKYHLGTLREVLTAEVIARELRFRGRVSRHIHVVDDLDVFRKVPAGIPESYQQYLGRPLCDIPSPDDPSQTYADYYLADLLLVAEKMHLSMEIMRAHKEYRAGTFVPAIETALAHVDEIKNILNKVSGRSLDENWSPVQVIEDGYLKNRRFVGLDTTTKELTYEGGDGHERTISYAHGDVKLNWRIDWPARWWMLHVAAEPFGRDHATKGGSYDTGAVIVKDIFGAEAPIPVPYHFVNRTGETKKMSKSAGNTITAGELMDVLPAELVWYFLLKSAPDKQLFFDAGPTLVRLFDECSALLAKADKTPDEEQLARLITTDGVEPTVSRVPFSHLVASYQASLKDVDKTLEVIRRTEHAAVVDSDEHTIKSELRFIDAWLQRWAPDDVTFSLRQEVDADAFSSTQKDFMKRLAGAIERAPADADGDWFHKAIYEYKEAMGLQPKDMFTTLYQALIGKDSGPRLGWFLSLLPRDWLVKRLELEA